MRCEQLRLIGQPKWYKQKAATLATLALPAYRKLDCPPGCAHPRYRVYKCIILNVLNTLYRDCLYLYFSSLPTLMLIFFRNHYLIVTTIISKHKRFVNVVMAISDFIGAE